MEVLPAELCARRSRRVGLLLRPEVVGPMSTMIKLDGASAEVSTYMAREVVLEVEDGQHNAIIFMTPGEAVRLSRALVKAAAEALGVEV